MAAPILTVDIEPFTVTHGGRELLVLAGIFEIQDPATRHPIVRCATRATARTAKRTLASGGIATVLAVRVLDSIDTTVMADRWVSPLDDLDVAWSDEPGGGWAT